MSELDQHPTTDIVLAAAESASDLLESRTDDQPDERYEEVTSSMSGTDELQVDQPQKLVEVTSETVPSLVEASEKQEDGEIVSEAIAATTAAADNATKSDSVEAETFTSSDTAAVVSLAEPADSETRAVDRKKSVQFQLSGSSNGPEPSHAGSTDSSPGSKTLERSLSRVSSMQANHDASVLISRLQNDIQELLVNGNESSEIFKGIFPADEDAVEETLTEGAVIQSFADDLSGLMGSSSSAPAAEVSNGAVGSNTSSPLKLSRTLTAGTLLMNENLSLQQEARERNIMIEELRSKVDMLSTILTDSVEKTALMEEEILTQSIQIGNLQESEILLKKENLMLSKKIAEQASELAHAQGIRSKMAETETIMNSLQEEMVQTLEKLLSTRQELKQLEEIDAIRLKEIAAYNQEVEELRQELRAKRSELAAAENANLETRTECERSIALTERKMADLQDATEMIRIENIRAKENLLRVKGAQEKWEQEKTELQRSIDAWKRMSLGTVSAPKSSSTIVSPLRSNYVGRAGAPSSTTATSTPRTPTLKGTFSVGAMDTDPAESEHSSNYYDDTVDTTALTAMEVGRNYIINQATTTTILDNFQRTYLSVAEVIASGDVERMKNELIGMAHQLEQMRTSNARLLNKLQAARGNIQVCCRTRPPSVTELAALQRMNNHKGNKGPRICVDVLDDNELACYDVKSEQWRSFAFDRVWKLDATQAEVFADVEPLVLSVIDGYNCCLMAYGQTGSGKTFTMNGIGEDYGISYRTLSRIFETLELKRESALATARKIREAAQRRLDHSLSSPSTATGTYGGGSNSSSPSKSASTPNAATAAAREKQLAEEISVLIAEEDRIMAGLEVEPFSYKVEISIMEVYNDQIHDLLVNQPLDGGNSPSLEVRQTPDGAVFVPGLIQVRLYSLEDVMAVFGRGSANRMTATTNLNERSSRSHLILQVTVTTQSEDQLPVRAKLSLVDLAGSERVSKSGSVGSAMKEAQYINKSLSALGDVMEALDQKHRHIPYRNSKLTYLLNDSLGGNSRTMMIVTLCPTELTTEETLFSLHFATRVRNITIGAARKNVNAKNLEDALKSIKADLRETRMRKVSLEEQVLALKRELKAKSERVIQQLDSKTRTVDDTKKYADIQIQQYARQNRELMTRLQEEKSERSHVSLELAATKRDLTKLKEKFKEYLTEKEALQREIKSKDREIAHLRLRQPRSPFTGDNNNINNINTSSTFSSSSTDLSVCSRMSSPERSSYNNNTSSQQQRNNIRESALRALEDATIDGDNNFFDQAGQGGGVGGAYHENGHASRNNTRTHQGQQQQLARTHSYTPRSYQGSSHNSSQSASGAAAALSPNANRHAQLYVQAVSTTSRNSESHHLNFQDESDGFPPHATSLEESGSSSAVNVGDLIAHYNAKTGGGGNADPSEVVPMNLESYTHPTFVNRSPDSPRGDSGGHKTFTREEEREGGRLLMLSTSRSDYSLANNYNGTITDTPHRLTGSSAEQSPVDTPGAGSGILYYPSSSYSSPDGRGLASSSFTPGKRYGSPVSSQQNYQEIIVGANGGVTPASAHYRPKMTPRTKEALLKHQQRLAKKRLTL